MPNKSRNQTGAVEPAELLLRVWKEQYNAARRYVLDAQKRGRDRDRFRVEGVSFLLLSLKEQLVSFTPFKALINEVETDYATFADLLNHS
jgi:hypothetical protein